MPRAAPCNRSPVSCLLRVTQRTYEIGLRMAIGATRRNIVSMVLKQGLRVALYGIAAGF
ncbi:MAG: FtsX-like permease family protein, partial [Bryobacteraceae bacterium]